MPQVDEYAEGAPREGPPLRHAVWRRQRGGAAARRARWTWRSLLSLLSAALLGGLVWLLLAPFRHPTPLIVGVSTLEAPVGAVLNQRLPEAPFAHADIADLHRIAAAVRPAGRVPAVWQESRTVESLASTARRFAALADDREHVLLVYLRTLAATVDGVPCVVGATEGNESGEERLPLSRLLEDLLSTRAGAVLLIIEAGDEWGDLGAERLVGEFPRLIGDAVAATRDPRLWVLTSHGPLERSHVLWSDERSVLGAALAAGLAGAADLDADRAVDVRELYWFLADRVSRVVTAKTGRDATQTPRMYWGGQGDPVSGNAPAIVPALLSKSTAGASLKADGKDVDPGTGGAKRAQAFRLGAIRSPPSLPATGMVSAPSVAMPAVPSAPGPAGSVIRVAASAATQPPGVAPSTSSAPAATQDASADPATVAVPPASTPQGASAGQAAAIGQSGAAPATNGTGPVGASPNDELPGLLLAAWELRDELERRERNPIDVAPHLWRELVRRLLVCERLYRGGADEQAEDLAFAVRNLLRTFDAAGRGEHVPPTIDRFASALTAAISENAQPLSAPQQSLAMSAALAARGGPPLLPGEVLLREGLNAVLERDDRAAFDEWLAQVPVAHDDFAEVGLARRLALRPAISWTLLRLALRVRRDAELAAAADDGSHGIRRLIEEGDRLRIEAEQELFDDVGVARFERAQRLLEDARALYGEAQAGRVLLGRARRLFLNLAYRLPDYVCWWSSGGPAAAACGPEYDELVALFDELEALSALVHGGALDDRGSLEARTSSVEALRSQVESWPTEQAAHALLNDASGFHTGWHVERLLETGLPRRPARLVMLQWLPELEARSLAGSGGAPTAAGRPPMRMMSSRDWSFLVRSADLERRLAGAAEWLLPVELQQRAALDGAYQALTGSRDHLRAAADSLAAEEAVWQSHRRFRAELYRFRRSLPARAGAVAAPRLDAQTPRAAEEKLAGVRAALHALRVGGTGELADLMAVNPGRELARSELASLLAWQSERLRRGAAVGDAPATEHLAASADRHRARAAELLAQAPEAGARAPALRVDSERVLRLIAESEQPLAIALGATTASPTKVWVLLKFDPRLLDVEGPPGLRVYQEGPLGRPRGEGVAAFEGSSGVDAGGAEDLPDDQSMSGIALAGLPETLVLGPGAPATVRFRVRRRAASDGPTRLIVRAVSEADSVRHSVEVRLPFPESVHFRVAGTPGSWREAEDGVVLQPFPNRDTDYRWQLENLTAAARSLDVQVLGLTQAKTVILPPGELAAEDAVLVLSQLGDLRGLGQYQDLTLAPGGGAAIPPTASPVVPPPATPDEARRRFEQSPSLLHGAVVAIADRATRRTALRFVGVEPQRPRRYVRPQVAYNLQRQRVEITVRAVDAAFVPPGGCSVRGELVEPREEASASQLSGVLQAPAFETRLFAEVPSRPGKVVHLRLHVDDYPRAFLYRLRCDVPATTIPELVDAAEVRITAPAAGAVFRSPLAAVPLELQVDAPAGAFDSPQDFVEAGLDLDRDRVLRGEPVVRLSADRQVDVRLVSAAPGAWTLNCEVGDFRVNVPAAGVESARVNLVGRLDVRGQTAWSAPLDVVIDGSPPVIRAVQLHPGSAVGPDDKLTATVQVDDGALSGAALVELAFDVERVGDFTPTTQAVAASPASSGRWTAALPAADLPPGTYGLLIRARDHAGNVSDVRRETVRVLTPAAAAANLAQRTGPVTGRALYGEQPISGASIVLKAADGKVLAEATSDKSGAFTLSRVAPGTYTVRAEGLVRNKLRRAEAEVTVPPPPASTDAVRLQLR